MTASSSGELTKSTLCCLSGFSEAAGQPNLGSTHFAAVKQPFVASRTRPQAVLRYALENIG